MYVLHVPEPKAGSLYFFLDLILDLVLDLILDLGVGVFFPPGGLGRPLPEKFLEWG